MSAPLPPPQHVSVLAASRSSALPPEHQPHLNSIHKQFRGKPIPSPLLSSFGRKPFPELRKSAPSSTQAPPPRRSPAPAPPHLQLRPRPKPHTGLLEHPQGMQRSGLPSRPGLYSRRRVRAQRGGAWSWGGARARGAGSGPRKVHDGEAWTQSPVKKAPRCDHSNAPLSLHTSPLPTLRHNSCKTRLGAHSLSHSHSFPPQPRASLPMQESWGSL